MYKVLRFGKFQGKNDGKEYRIMDVLDCSTNSIIIDEFVDKDFSPNDIVEPILVVNRSHKLQVRGWKLIKGSIQ